MAEIKIPLPQEEKPQGLRFASKLMFLMWILMLVPLTVLLCFISSKSGNGAASKLNRN